MSHDGEARPSPACNCPLCVASSTNRSQGSFWQDNDRSHSRGTLTGGFCLEKQLSFPGSSGHPSIMAPTAQRRSGAWGSLVKPPSGSGVGDTSPTPPERTESKAKPPPLHSQTRGPGSLGGEEEGASSSFQSPGQLRTRWGGTISSQTRTLRLREVKKLPQETSQEAAELGWEPGLPPRGATEWKKPRQEQACAPPAMSRHPATERDGPATGPGESLSAPQPLVLPLPPSPSSPLAWTPQRAPHWSWPKGSGHNLRGHGPTDIPQGSRSHSSSHSRRPPYPAHPSPCGLFHCPRPLSIPQDIKCIPSQSLCRGLQGPRPAAAPSLGVGQILHHLLWKLHRLWHPSAPPHPVPLLPHPRT